jgi:hypothetical protein
MIFPEISSLHDAAERFDFPLQDANCSGGQEVTDPSCSGELHLTAAKMEKSQVTSPSPLHYAAGSQFGIGSKVKNFLEAPWALEKIRWVPFHI